jgi:hypothetical protein
LIDFLYHGKRGVDKPGLGKYNLELLGYESQYFALLEAGVSSDTIVIMKKIYFSSFVLSRLSSDSVSHCLLVSHLQPIPLDYHANMTP